MTEWNVNAIDFALILTWLLLFQAEEMEAHENYVALFRAEEHVRNDVMHEPALKIAELDKV